MANMFIHSHLSGKMNLFINSQLNAMMNLFINLQFDTVANMCLFSMELPRTQVLISIHYITDTLVIEVMDETLLSSGRIEKTYV